MTKLAGKVIAITGGAGGLGRAYALRLASRGAHIALVDINEQSARGVSDEVRLQGGRCEAFTADLTNRETVVSAFESIAASLGTIDVLINNAGGVTFSPTPMEDIGLEQWLRALAVNLTSTWLCTQSVVPAMKRRRSGKIINISTTIVSKGQPIHLSPYVAAKGGVVALTRTLAKELGAFEVTVNAVAPGVVPHKLAGQSASAASPVRATLVDAVVAEQALQRIAVPDDLCGAVEFLASSDSDFITGQVFNVDGGWAFG